jgi:hypothetical protein
MELRDGKGIVGAVVQPLPNHRIVSDFIAKSTDRSQILQVVLAVILPRRKRAAS